MKTIALKAFVSLSCAFAAYYAFFLGSVFYELYVDDVRCGTGQIWALQGAAVFFAPPAFLGCFGLWFTGKQKQTLGTVFPRVSRVSLMVLALCTLINLMIFIPTL